MTATVSRFSEAAADESTSAYRPLSKFAVLALCSGLLSPLAWVHPVLWSIPAITVAMGAMALWHITRPDADLTGSKVALLGIGVALVSGIGAPVRALAVQQLILRDGNQFALQWFEYLRHEQPHMAHQLCSNISGRQPLDDQLWQFYRERPEWADDLRHFVGDPLIRTLLVLGKRMQVRLYEVHGLEDIGRSQAVVMTYAVTYEEAGAKKTFLVTLLMERHFNSIDQRGRWKIQRTLVRQSLGPPESDESPAAEDTA